MLNGSNSHEPGGDATHGETPAVVIDNWETLKTHFTAVSSRNIKREHLNGILTLFLHTIVNLS